MKINISLDRKLINPVYIPYFDDNTRTQIFFGGASSGKSVAIVGQRTVYDLLRGDRNYLVIRNVGRTSRTSTFNEIRKTILKWKIDDFFKINKADMVITCINGKQILFHGLDDVAKLKSITPEKGVITDILVEEATETKEDDIKQLEKRLRGKSTVKKRITLIFNPILRSHWIFDRYFAGRFFDNDTEYNDGEITILKTTYKDNGFLEQDDIYALEYETDEYFRDVYTLGKWGIFGDVIFKNWKAEDLKEQKPFFDNIKNGLDFGFSSHPMAYNRCHYDVKRKKLYIFNELHECGLTNQQLARQIKPIVGMEKVVCDSAEPKSIEELRQEGVKAVGAEKGKDSVRFGIQWLQDQEIIIDRACQETINEFQQYQWKKNKSGETLMEPVNRNDHHIDSIRYALEDSMPTKRKRGGAW